jgi:hypothetical protein
MGILIKVDYTCVWKCDEEILYYVQFNIYQLKFKKEIEARGSVMLSHSRAIINNCNVLYISKS